MDEIILLNRIRVDIGNVSGSLSELMQYAGMAGFNDAGEEQTKPRLVGTWTINDWYTQEQLAQAQAAFDGLTIVPDPNYLINFNDLAVQVLDSTKPNYNPAVAIILQSNGIGKTLDSAPYTGGGRWFLTKTEAESITTIGSWFQGVQSVNDDHCIVSDTAAIYNFTSGKEFLLFKNLQGSYNMLSGCRNLTKLGIPNSFNFVNIGYWVAECPITEIYLTDIYPYIIRDVNGETNEHPFGRTQNNHIYVNDVEITELNIPDNVNSIGSFAFRGCSNITSVYLNNVTSLNPYAFVDCINLVSITFKTPNPLTTIRNSVFTNTPFIETDEFVANLQTMGYDTYGEYYINNNKKQHLKLPSIVTLCMNNVNANRFVEYGPNLTKIASWVGFQGNCSSRFTSPTPPTMDIGGMNPPSSWKIYIGNGINQSDDEALLQVYANATWWSTYASQMDTWYNYLHPTT